MELVPIKVKIGLRRVRIRGTNNFRREADHPDWKQVALPANGEHINGDGTDPDDYVLGSWHYDKTSGHQENNGTDSPLGMQWGMRLVTPQFAVNAVAAFPNIISIMTEAEAQDFYDTRCYAHMPEARVEGTMLQDLKAELELREELGEDTSNLRNKIRKALDPDDPEPGMRRQRGKFWTQHCQECDFTIEDPAKTRRRRGRKKEPLA